MAVYTRLHKNDILAIGDRYNLAIVDYEKISAGATNSNYLVRTQMGRYILTVLEESTLHQAAALGRLLLLLKNHPFPTTVPLRTANGNVAIRHKGKPVMLKVFVTGRVQQDLNQNMLRQIGGLMARLHQIPAPSDLAQKQTYGMRKYPAVRRQALDSEFGAWIRQRISFFERQNFENLPQGLIHGDLFYDNVLFEGTKLKAFIDFEEALCAEKVFDLGMGIVGLCRAGEGVQLEKVRALREGYEQIRVMQTREKRALKLFVEYAAVTVACWRYWKNHVDVSNEAEAAKHMHMVRVAEMIRGIPAARWLEIVFD